MCQLDLTVEKMFATTIGEFVEQGRAFTGYDLTLRTREREKVKLRHADCRQGVHEMQLLIDLVEFDTWNKDLHDLGNGLQAILYYPSGYDKSLYQPVSVVQFVPSTPPLVSTTSSMAVGSPLGSDDDDDDTDDPKDLIIVKNQVDSVVLCTADPTTINMQVVERNGEVRLSKRRFLHLEYLAIAPLKTLMVISSLKVLKHILIIFKNLMRLLHKKVKNVYHRHIH